MSESEPTRDEFDLFISYAHKDNLDEHEGKVTAMVEAIMADHRAFAGAPPRVFFDVEAIRSMDDWEHRILKGLRQSKLMVAVLSPAYFNSEYCRKEWEHYVETELALALPGEGVQPIYVAAHPAFDGDLAALEERLRHWMKDLKRRQYIDWRPYWPEGVEALQLDDARKRLAKLPGQIADRLKRQAVRDAAPNTVPLPSIHFKGRRDEMRELRAELIKGQIGAITALHGVAGIGKSMLAFAYAWGYGGEYPGGRFRIDAANLGDLASGVIALAEPLNLVLTDDERKDSDAALRKVKAALEAGPRDLIVIDNVDDPALLTAKALDRALPKGNHIHALLTTRAEPANLDRIHCLALDSLETEDALALLNDYRPIADAPVDAEWKAAQEIVRRLAGHALALEVVGVFLRENPGVSCQTFAEGLERDGVGLIDSTVAPEAVGKLAWHPEASIARLLEPTLAALAPEELRAVEYAAFLPPDNVPLPWLQEQLIADFPALGRLDEFGRLSVEKVFKRLEQLRLVVRQARHRNQPTADDRLARMHRIVAEVTRNRLAPEAGAARQLFVHALALNRGVTLKTRWGQRGLAWEIAPMRDLAASWIADGDPFGPRLLENITKPLQDTGRMSEALDLWRRAVDLHRRLHESAPDSINLARALSISLNNQGDLALSGGDRAAARSLYEERLAISRRLCVADPDSADLARDLAASLNKLGDLALSGGDRSSARSLYEEGLAIARRLHEAAPDSADLARGLSVSLDRLGDLVLCSRVVIARRRGRCTRRIWRSRGGCMRRLPTAPTWRATWRSHTGKWPRWRPNRETRAKLRCSPFFGPGEMGVRID